ncbi:hypothetical protein DPEC_G00113480 [Dallia pectoralis]|uniref:Uncharacterized protein n=1 Tax=Dallia pectoralis TaxID=75939 RepID=A0ACC2GUG3_DALPE|nr:hypothetical protein DPEC_G00113480 [Dallia pectoralis]
MYPDARRPSSDSEVTTGSSWTCLLMAPVFIDGLNVSGGTPLARTGTGAIATSSSRLLWPLLWNGLTSPNPPPPVSVETAQTSSGFRPLCFTHHTCGRHPGGNWGARVHPVPSPTSPRLGHRPHLHRLSPRPLRMRGVGGGGRHAFRA